MVTGRGTAALWLRWSWRDLRKRWLLVGAIAIILALGTGTFAGLGSTAAWRRETNDASFSRLRMHDVRVTLTQGATVDEGALASLARTIPDAQRIVGVEEHLVGATQVDASHEGETILVPGEVVGVDVRDTLDVDALHLAGGRALRPGDDGEAVVLLEQQFADHYDLGDQGTMRLSGGAAVDYVGTGTSPQFFLVTGSTGALFAQGSLAVLFAPLSTAQALLGEAGKVNEVVVTLDDPSATGAVERQLVDAIDEQLGAGATATRKADEPAYRMLYEDIENDQQFWNIIAGLILAGATFAAFNLTTRMIDAQRREIGVGMALGVPSVHLAVRPLLVGVQIAALGAVAGLAVGYLLDIWLAGVFENILPMPEWRTPFQTGTFVRAAALGFVLPILATAIPVWRAVRVQPVDAIRIGHLAAKGGGLAPLLARVPLRGRTFRQMPFRNLLRTPRRTLMTALAIGAAVTTLIAVIGMVDSFVRTLDRGEAAVTGDTPDRLVIALDTFRPADAPEVAAIADAPEVGRAEPTLRLFGTLTGDDEFDVMIDLVDFDAGLWQPALHGARAVDVRAGGIVLSANAARDLGVAVDDEVTMRHPRREGLSYRLVESQVRVVALHDIPLRAVAFMDAGQANLFDLEGIVNLVNATPADGYTTDEVKRGVFSLPGVAAVETVTATTESLRETLNQYFSILRIAELIVLALTVLVAFNTASISIDERAREHATMLAFGLRARTVLGMATIEAMVAGILGTVLGVGAGFGVVQWMMQVQLRDTMPDLYVESYVSAETLVTAIAVGVVAVALAPLFTARRVSRMDIPATLRVME